jgi:hypothetical protein
MHTLLEKPPVVKLLKNFPAFYGTQRLLPCSQVHMLSQINPIHVFAQQTK